ncbi:deacetylase-like protein [Apiospora arundinis]
MVQSRKERKAAEKTPAGIKLSHPDRSGPTDTTLLDWATERKLFDEADARQRALGGGKKTAAAPAAGEPVYVGKREDAVLTTTADRILEAMLWTVSLCTLHFTLDVLVQQQYAVNLEWPVYSSSLFYIIHPHPSSPILVPGLPKRYQEPIRQTIFFAVSIAAGCHLIKITNTYGYLAVMKRSPPLGCLWVWSVIELNLLPAAASVGTALAYLWLGFR